jgi:hypothetical protein
MKSYEIPVVNVIKNILFPMMTQTGQAELACSSEPNCAASGDSQFDYCCDDTSDMRLSQKIRTAFACNEFQFDCDFQADSSTNFNCSSVSLTPLGECEGNCIYLMTCEGFSGSCPGEEHIQAACTSPH